MNPDTATDTLILVHRIVGYPTAFIIAPIGLLAFARASIHRRWGRAYFYLIVFLYLTGTWLTLTQHDWGTWSFARNVTFNFFGFSMVLYGYRAIRLYRSPEPRATRVDWYLAGLLLTTVVALLAVAVWKDTPMRVFTLVGIWLVVLEFRELRGGLTDRALLYRRHQRYILASYFYVLTVVSIVHLNDELPRKAKWLWPTLVGLLVVWLLTARKKPWGLPARTVVIGVFALVAAYGAYVVYDLLSGAALTLQGSATP
jgi:hypothetical protein